MVNIPGDMISMANNQQPINDAMHQQNRSHLHPFHPLNMEVRSNCRETRWDHPEEQVSSRDQLPRAPIRQRRHSMFHPSNFGVPSPQSWQPPQEHQQQNLPSLPPPLMSRTSNVLPPPSFDSPVQQYLQQPQLNGNFLQQQPQPQPLMALNIPNVVNGPFVGSQNMQSYNAVAPVCPPIRMDPRLQSMARQHAFEGPPLIRAEPPAVRTPSAASAGPSNAATEMTKRKIPITGYRIPSEREMEREKERQERLNRELERQKEIEEQRKQKERDEETARQIEKELSEMHAPSDGELVSNSENQQSASPITEEITIKSETEEIAIEEKASDESTDESDGDSDATVDFNYDKIVEDLSKNQQKNSNIGNNDDDGNNHDEILSNSIENQTEYPAGNFTNI